MKGGYLMKKEDKKADNSKPQKVHTCDCCSAKIAVVEKKKK